ncbi:MAG TPA: CDP-alcohol phosphatidyltransferase family protein [Candidatus Binatia bacterium]
MLNLPNFLTLIRIATIPLFLLLLFSRHYTWALAVFAFGGLTDALDGPVARWTKQRTRLGAYLDPMADKLLIISSLVVLTYIGATPGWLTILVLSRDLIITLGYGALYFWIQQKMEILPSFMGKANTFLLLLTITVILVNLHDRNLIPDIALPMGPLRFHVLDGLFFLTSVTTIISGLQYVYRGLVWLQERVSPNTRAS